MAFGKSRHSEKRKKRIKEKEAFLLVEFPLNNKETTTFIFPSLFSVFVSYFSSFAQGRGGAEGEKRGRDCSCTKTTTKEERRRGTKGTYGKTKEGFAGHF